MADLDPADVEAVARGIRAVDGEEWNEDIAWIYESYAEAALTTLIERGWRKHER